MAAAHSPITAIVVFLRQPRPLDTPTVERIAKDAFRDAPAPPKVVSLPNGSFGVLLGPLRIGIVSVDKPYYNDIAAAADSVTDFAARQAIQKHSAWMTFDLVGQAPMELDRVHDLIGCMVAEVLDDNVLGLLRLPNGPIIGYDFSLIPLLRNRKSARAFSRPLPDRSVKTNSRHASALAAATAEAQRRLPEFLQDFANSSKGQGFAVKKSFSDENGIEHMWVSLEKIEGSIIYGWLANEPNTVRNMRLRDRVSLSLCEIEDWVYSRGKENVGLFQSKVLHPEP